jgi:hypothetical protein
MNEPLIDSLRNLSAIQVDLEEDSEVVSPVPESFNFHAVEPWPQGACFEHVR